ncbi:MAG TPA: histidinol-phosphate transaminase [Verrucomicrobiales bacterium]|nr:histidinol-phosphate transaminase [Verrucomicrobiales bacterium]
MKLPILDHLKSLATYQPGRPIEEVARELKIPFNEVIKLASNENPLGPSPKAIQAMQDALPSVHLYPDGNVFYLKNKMANHLDVSPKSLVFGNGSNELIEWIGHVLLSEKSNIVVSQYCFAIYPIIAAMFGAQTKTVSAKHYGHDLHAMAEAVDQRTRVVFVANPNNPTGTLLEKSSVTDFLARIPDDVLIVMDEAYFEYLSDPSDLLPLIRSGKKPNLLLMRTFSKIYGLSGLRIGYGVGSPELIQRMEKVRQPFNVNAIAQAGALAALDDQEHVDRTRLNNAEGVEFFQKAFVQMGLEHVPSHANFVLVKVGDGKQVFDFLQKNGVITRPMAGYQLPEWLRISVGLAKENQRCLDVLKLALG